VEKDFTCLTSDCTRSLISATALTLGKESVEKLVVAEFEVGLLSRYV
jgi:hypothetical protein